MNEIAGRPKIERTYFVDLDVVHGPDENGVRETCDELTAGLLIQHSVLIGGEKFNGWPVVRFTGPRNQLEELLNRYDGVPGAFAPDEANPESGS